MKYGAVEQHLDANKSDVGEETDGPFCLGKMM